MKYVRPDLEELELILEGSYLADKSGFNKDPEEGGFDGDND